MGFSKYLDALHELHKSAKYSYKCFKYTYETYISFKWHKKLNLDTNFSNMLLKFTISHKKIVRLANFMCRYSRVSLSGIHDLDELQ